MCAKVTVGDCEIPYQKPYDKGKGEGGDFAPFASPQFLSN